MADARGYSWGTIVLWAVVTFIVLGVIGWRAGYLDDLLSRPEPVAPPTAQPEPTTPPVQPAPQPQQ